MSYAWHEIRDHLMTVSSTLDFHHRFGRLRVTEPELADFSDPAALLDHLHQVQGDPEGKNQLLRALIRAAQSDGPCADHALTLLLLALWPGLDAVRQRSVRRRLGAPEDIAADVLARATEAFRGLALDRVNRIAATVLRNIERDMIRAKRRARIFKGNPDSNDLAAQQAPDEKVFANLLLWHDMPRLVGEDARLVRAVALHGFTQAEVGAVLGLSADAARKRHQRALRRLRKCFAENV